MSEKLPAIQQEEASLEQRLEKAYQEYLAAEQAYIDYGCQKTEEIGLPRSWGALWESQWRHDYSTRYSRQRAEHISVLMAELELTFPEACDLAEVPIPKREEVLCWMQGRAPDGFFSFMEDYPLYSGGFRAGEQRARREIALRLMEELSLPQGRAEFLAGLHPSETGHEGAGGCRFRRRFIKRRGVPGLIRIA